MKTHIAASLAVCLAASSTAVQVIVNTTYGQVEGYSDGTITTFHSIPFAAPPVGSLRFRAPQPPTAWSGVLDTTGLPEPCPQLKVDGTLFLGNEDCLYLQVYVPEEPIDKGPLPVMFWIFGGAYVLGDSSEFGWYDGTNLAKNNDVIVVTVNYRVGPFGFMALSGLQSEDPNNSTGNAALQDQTMGLQWVRDNIANFGGDPTRVTIFGESAGGFSICWHLVNQNSAGLFAAAIMESGSCDSPQFFQPLPFAISWNTIYASAVGCDAATLAPLASGEDPLVACLRAVSTEDLMKSLEDMLNPNWPFTNTSAQLGSLSSPHLNMTDYFQQDVNIPASISPNSLPSLAPVMPWGPAIDFSVAGLMDLPLTLITKGQWNKVPFILGTNGNEGSIFIPIMPLVVPNTTFPPTDADIPRIVDHAYDMYPTNNLLNITQTVMAAYPPYANGNNWERAADLLTHCFFSCGTRRTARAIASQGVPVYLYQFTHKLSFLMGLEYDLLGDYHTSEMYFVWRNEWPPLVHVFDDNDWTIANAINGFWTNFAATGNPNTGPAAVTLQWPEYSPLTDLNMQLQVPLNITQHLLQSKCNMWDAVTNALDASVEASRGA